MAGLWLRAVLMRRARHPNDARGLPRTTLGRIPGLSAGVEILD